MKDQCVRCAATPDELYILRFATCDVCIALCEACCYQIHEASGWGQWGAAA